MKIFTHHPRDFRLDGPPDYFDPKQGSYWRDSPAYREALPLLQKRVGTDNFLWFEVVPTHERMTESHDLVRWELEIPFGEILAFIHEDGNWTSLFGKSPNVDWSKLLAKPSEAEVIDNPKYCCLVRYPVIGAVMCEMRPKYPSSLKP